MTASGPDPDPEPISATYAEVRDRFGLKSADHARIMARRQGWPPLPRNHPGDLAIVRVPRAAWDAATPPAVRPPRTPPAPALAAPLAPDGPSPAAPVPPPAPSAVPPPVPPDAGWTLAVAVLREQVEQERRRAERAEAKVDRAEDRVDRAEARAERAEARAERTEGQAAAPAAPADAPFNPPEPLRRLADSRIVRGLLNLAQRRRE